MSENTTKTPIIEMQVYEDGNFNLLFDTNKQQEFADFLYRITTGKFDSIIIKFLYEQHPTLLIPILTKWVQHAYDAKKSEPAIHALQAFEKLPF